jgi:excisionase family DNA binding protein
MSKARTPPRVPLLTTREAAAALGVHERTLRRYISAGLLRYRRLPGGHYRVSEDAILGFWRNDAEARGDRRRATATDRPRAGVATDPKRGSASTRDGALCGGRGASEDRSLASYDLSLETLAALRARVRASDG